MIRIYVGNLPVSAAYNDLMDAFSAYGTVHQLEIITDRSTGRSKGFAFVEMSATEGRAAIAALNGADYDGRHLEVHEAPNKNSRHRPGSSHQRTPSGDSIRTWRQT
jgi:RNA recognition motif-containing protein